MVQWMCMRLLLVPDPTSPHGEDAFCREIEKRAAARGHQIETQAVPQELSDFDLILVNSLQATAVLAALEAKRKCVIRLIDTYATASSQTVEEVKRLVLAADRILVPSQFLARIVAEWGANGKVAQVPYAYDRIHAQQIALVTVRASKPSFQLVAANSIDESTRPGFETLLSALARLRIDWHLNIMGEGPGLAALKTRAQQLGISDKVAFLGSMPHEKLMEFFRTAKAYVDPCGLEGFPTLSLHALSEGCPVIAARAGAVEELIHDDKNGLLFNPGDALGLSEAIVTLWSVRGLSLRLIAEGIKTVGHHSWDATASSLFDAIEALPR